MNVIGQKWSWTFNYMEAGNPSVGAVVHQVGTIDKIPDLYLPVNKPVRFNLTSADVIHSFWMPAFYFKLDVIPGHPNSFDVTPDKEGIYSRQVRRTLRHLPRRDAVHGPRGQRARNTRRT